MPLTIWVIPLTHGWLQTAARGWKRTGRTSSSTSFLSISHTCAYRLYHPNIVPMETAEPSD